MKKPIDIFKLGYGLIFLNPLPSLSRPIRARRYIAFCDVLGFSRMINEKNPLEIHEQYRKTIGRVRARKSIRYETRDKQGNVVRKKIPIFDYVSFSDSIIIWSSEIPDTVPLINGSDPSPSTLSDWWWSLTPFELLGPPPKAECAVVMGAPERSLSHTEQVILDFFISLKDVIVEGLMDGLPLRIGIAFGDSVIDTQKGIYLGKAIVDAYHSEEGQKWIGGACHKSSCADALGFDVVQEWGYVTKDLVPVRPEASLDLLALNWPGMIISLSEGDLCRPALTKGLASAGDAAEKWNNTLRFFDMRYED